MNRGRILLVVSLTLLAAAVTAAWSQAKRQLSVPANPAAVVSGGSLVVVVSPNNRDVWAYSKLTGQWHLQSLPLASKQPIQPLTGDVVAVFQAGSQVYAFSGQLGVWQVLDLEEGVQARPQIMEDWCFLVAGTNAYAFSAMTGKWAVQDLRVP